MDEQGVDEQGIVEGFQQMREAIKQRYPDKTEAEALNIALGVNTSDSNGESAGKRVEMGEYDLIVKIVKGRHRGKIGYCDDVASAKSGIVYFGTPLVAGSTSE